tara:strand:+ start:143 stop:490 length:348 start_codon:yes stop_codon:yes gene_type:complete
MLRVLYHGPMEDANLEALQELVDDYEITLCDPDDTPDYKDHDVFAFPGIKNIDTKYIIAALKNGLPVAAFDLDETRNIVYHGLNGALTMFGKTFKQAVDEASMKDGGWLQTQKLL